MKIVRTLEEIKQLPLNTELFIAQVDDVKWYYYGGVNPKSPRAIILINSGNVQKMEGIYIGDAEVEYYLDYEECCQIVYEKAKENVETVKRIFIDKRD